MNILIAVQAVEMVQKQKKGFALMEYVHEQRIKISSKPLIAMKGVVSFI